MPEKAHERLLSCTALIFGLDWCGRQAALQLLRFGFGQIVLHDANKKLLSETWSWLTAAGRELNRQQNTTLIKDLPPLDAHHCESLVAKADVVIESFSEWQQKLLISDVCMRLKKPLVHAGGSGNFRFQIYAMQPGKSACLRCALPIVRIEDVTQMQAAENKFEPGVIMAASLQAMEAIKIVSKLGVTQGNELLKFDCLSGEWEIIRGLDPRSDCPDCAVPR